MVSLRERERERERDRQRERAIVALDNLTIIGLLIVVVLSYVCVSYAWYQPVYVVFPCHVNLYLAIMRTLSKEKKDGMCNIYEGHLEVFSMVFYLSSRFTKP